MNYDNNMKGSAWKKTSKNGVQYLGGSIVIDGREFWINIFKNERKQSEKSPDYNISLSPKENQSQGNYQKNQGYYQKNVNNVKTVFQNPWDNQGQGNQNNNQNNQDDIPF